MSRLPEVPDEAMLAAALADAISRLSALESYEPGGEKDFDLSWTDGHVRNNATSSSCMMRAVEALVEKNLAELQQEAIAWARGNVTKARDALQAYYGSVTKPGDAVARAWDSYSKDIDLNTDQTAEIAYTDVIPTGPPLGAGSDEAVDSRRAEIEQAYDAGFSDAVASSGETLEFVGDSTVFFMTGDGVVMADGALVENLADQDGATSQNEDAGFYATNDELSDQFGTDPRDEAEAEQAAADRAKEDESVG